MNTAETNNNVPWSVWDAIYIMVFIFFVSLLISGVISYLNIDKENLLLNIIVQITLPAISLFCIYLTLTKFYKIPFLSSLGLTINKENIKKHITSGVFISFIIFFFSVIISITTFVVTNKIIENPYKEYTPSQMQIISLLSIFMAPFFEEIFFRGFMQPAACKSMGDIPGVFFVAVVFAFIHQQYLANIPAMCIMLALSLVLGFSRLYLKSTVPCIIGHLLNNVYASLFLLMSINA